MGSVGISSIPRAKLTVATTPPPIDAQRPFSITRGQIDNVARQPAQSREIGASIGGAGEAVAGLVHDAEDELGFMLELRLQTELGAG